MTLDAVQIALIGTSFFTGIAFFSLCYRNVVDVSHTEATHLGENQENDDEEAVQQALSLTEGAKKEIEMFDDGDLSDEFKSLYNDDRFVDLLKNKLSDPTFRVRAFFNDGDPSLKFISEFKHHKQVEIYKLKPNKPRTNASHYRLIDGGIKGVISRHGQGVGKRMYRELSVSENSGENIASVGKTVLRRYRQPKKHFKKLDG